MRLQSIERKRTFCSLVIINFINSSRPSSSVSGTFQQDRWLNDGMEQCNVIVFHEFLFITGKNCSLIRDNNIWNAMSGRDFCQFLILTKGDQRLQQNWSSRIIFGSKSGSGDHFGRLFCHNWSSQTNFSGDQFWWP